MHLRRLPTTDRTVRGEGSDASPLLILRNFLSAGAPLKRALYRVWSRFSPVPILIFGSAAAGVGLSSSVAMRHTTRRVASVPSAVAAKISKIWMRFSLACADGAYRRPAGMPAEGKMSYAQFI